MIARSSEGIASRAGTRLSNEHGAVFIFVVLSLFLLLGAAGIALDLGHAYLERQRIARAADAAALAAARNFREGQSAAEAEAVAVARANGLVEGGATNTLIRFGHND